MHAYLRLHARVVLRPERGDGPARLHKGGEVSVVVREFAGVVHNLLALNLVRHPALIRQKRRQNNTDNENQ